MSMPAFDEDARACLGLVRGFYSIGEVAKVTKTSRSAIEREIQAGRLKAVKFGLCYRIRGAWVDDWIKERWHDA